MKNRSNIDKWLESLGYYRKLMAHDETCLFRAVSEQVFNTQLKHEDIRNDCLKYADENRHVFPDLVDDWDTYLSKLKNHTIICGTVELQIISKKYKYDIAIFDGRTFSCIDINNSFGRKILLCQTVEDHFDNVYRKVHIENTGFCQSLVYNILYERVFKLEDTASVVNSMLCEKTNEKVYTFDPEVDRLVVQQVQNNDESSAESRKKECVFAPFPYKVAKALHPDTYRNVAFDIWGELRKEWRLSSWYQGDADFKVGTRCILTLEEGGNTKTLHCYIQKMGRRTDPVYVYIEETCEFRNISYDQLQPEPNAKPWTLPFRYLRSKEGKKQSKEQTNTSKKGGGKKANKMKKASNTKQEFSDTAIKIPEPNEINNNNNNFYNFLGSPINLGSNEECQIKTVSSLEVKEVDVPHWSPEINMNVLAIPQGFYLPPRSVDPNFNDLPKDNHMLQYYYNMGIEYCQFQMAAGPMRQQMINECSVSSQCNVTDSNNNYTYFSQITTETYGLSRCCTPNDTLACNSAQESELTRAEPTVQYINPPPPFVPPVMQCPPFCRDAYLPVPMNNLPVPQAVAPPFYPPVISQLCPVYNGPDNFLYPQMFGEYPNNY